MTKIEIIENYINGIDDYDFESIFLKLKLTITNIVGIYNYAYFDKDIQANHFDKVEEKRNTSIKSLSGIILKLYEWHKEQIQANDYFFKIRFPAEFESFDNAKNKRDHLISLFDNAFKSSIQADYQKEIIFINALANQLVMLRNDFLKSIKLSKDDPFHKEVAIQAAMLRHEFLKSKNKDKPLDAVIKKITHIKTEKADDNESDFSLSIYFKELEFLFLLRKAIKAQLPGTKKRNKSKPLPETFAKLFKDKEYEKYIDVLIDDFHLIAKANKKYILCDGVKSRTIAMVFWNILKVELSLIGEYEREAIQTVLFNEISGYEKNRVNNWKGGYNPYDEIANEIEEKLSKLKHA